MNFLNSNIPLAVYRELAAHLQQIEGVTVKFLEPIDREFNYTKSQLGGLEILGVDGLAPCDRQTLDRILSYYVDRYDRTTPQSP